MAALREQAQAAAGSGAVNRPPGREEWYSANLEQYFELRRTVYRNGDCNCVEAALQANRNGVLEWFNTRDGEIISHPVPDCQQD